MGRQLLLTALSAAFSRLVLAPSRTRCTLPPLQRSYRYPTLPEVLRETRSSRGTDAERTPKGKVNRDPLHPQRNPL